MMALTSPPQDVLDLLRIETLDVLNGFVKKAFPSFSNWTPGAESGLKNNECRERGNEYSRELYQGW